LSRSRNSNSSCALRHQSTITQSTRLCQDIVCKRGGEKYGRQHSGDAYKQSASTSAAKDGAGATAKYDPHALLPGLQKHKNHQKNASQNMNGQNKGLQRFLLA